MVAELSLTRTNRLRIARAFADSRRVDIGIDCAIEGQMGRVLADDPVSPTAFKIEQGPFGYFAGRADSAGGRALIGSLLPWTLLMPSSPAWLELARNTYQAEMQQFVRHSYSARALSVDHPVGRLNESGLGESIRPLGTLEQLIKFAGFKPPGPPP